MGKNDIEIRIAKPEERETVITVFLKFLQYMDQFEHDMLPTRENAVFFTDTYLMPAAARGEPVLIAWKEGQAIGGMFWVVQPLLYQSRWKMAYGYGTYINEEYRSQGLGTEMRKKGFEILKALGVERATGMVLFKNKLSVANCDHMGAMPYARMDHYLVK